MGERSEKEIAEIVAAQAAPRMKTILKKPAEQRFIFREGHHAVANVAGRKDAIFAAKAARAAAVVRYGDDGGEVGDGALPGGMTVALTGNVFAQTTQQGREAGTSSKRDHAQTARRDRFHSSLVHDWLNS